MDAITFAGRHMAGYAVACLLILSVMLFSPSMAAIEGRLLPVTSPISFDRVTQDGEDMLVQFTYEKLRLCEYLSTTAYQQGRQVSFKAESPGGTSTRLPGYQVSGIWRLKAPTLVGLEVYFLHRCSALWLTLTKVYG